ncbi:unnamed protein product [Aphanomyces euteiches]
MECRKELEDLILEVYENLQSDGVNILLPDDIARKIHGMVHLVRDFLMRVMKLIGSYSIERVQRMAMYQKMEA